MAPSFDSSDDFIRAGGPGKRFGIFVGFGDEAIDGGLEIDESVEDAAFERRLASLAKKPSTALSQEEEVGVKWKTN